MFLKSRILSLSASSALTVLLGLPCIQHAQAAGGFDIIGLSDDGSTLLSTEYSMKEIISLTSTATGSSTTIEAPSGADHLSFKGLSADGQTVVGSYDINGESMAVTWSAATGFVEIGNLGWDSSYATAVSADGLAVAGNLEKHDGSSEAFRWTKSGGMFNLGTLGGSKSSVQNISADGKTVVGYSSRLDLSEHAFVWHGSILDIDTLYTSSRATMVSKDGSVVAGSGYSSASSPYHVFRWTRGGQMVDIGSLDNSFTFLRAMSGNGDVLVGNSYLADNSYHAYRYVASTNTMTDLETLGGASSDAYDTNADGSVVVGTSTDAQSVSRGFRWTAAGMVSVEDWLASEGVTSGPTKTMTAKFVSDDGNVIVGMTHDYTPYIARVGGGQSGIIDTATYFPTVAATGNVMVQSGVKAADTIMFGAQGAPMRSLLQTGQKSVWGTVDGGYDDGDNADGGLVLGEFGFGYGIADDVTARFSAGGTYTNQDLDAGGDIRQRGFYLSPEVSADLGRNVYLTVGGYWGRNSVDSRRGYLNGGVTDYSKGDTDAETWAAKVRLDWLNAAEFNGTAITPYAGLSYARTKVDAFTETGGAFPVSYGETSDHSTIARIGADFVHPLNDTTRLLAKAELDYQFEDTAAATRGTLIGLGDFNLAGQDLKQFWARGGIGAEVDVGGGTASFMVNATTQGQDPDVWVRSNWTVKF